jgi:hypothetical protein
MAPPKVACLQECYDEIKAIDLAPSQLGEDSIIKKLLNKLQPLKIAAKSQQLNLKIP